MQPSGLAAKRKYASAIHTDIPEGASLDLNCTTLRGSAADTQPTRAAIAVSTPSSFQAMRNLRNLQHERTQQNAAYASTPAVSRGQLEKASSRLVAQRAEGYYYP